MKKPFFTLAICLGIATGALAQDQPKRFYIANDDHTDFMWTADANTYSNVFIDMLDFHQKLIDETAKNPSDFQDRFNVDGSYWLWNYERRKTPAEFEHLMANVKDGHIGAPLTTLVSTYGAQPTEAVIRGLYYAGRLERRYDIRFDLAEANENQTLPLGLSSLFAGSGAHYIWRGVCGCATQLPKGVLGDRGHELYWYTGKDGQRQLMKWYSLGPNFMGTYSEASYPESSINTLETNKGYIARNVDPVTKKPYDVYGIFGYGGDALERKTAVPGGDPALPPEPGMAGLFGYGYTDHFHVIAARASNPKRQVVVSNELDFFHDFEKRYGANLDSETLTYGNEWDLYSASMSETSARVKRAVEKLRAAELMGTLVSLKKPDYLRGRDADRDQAFTDLGLYWEHDWTADGRVSRPFRAAWEEQLADGIDYYVNSLHEDCALRLGALIKRPAKEQRFFVLNPLGYARTDFADYLYTGSANIHVRDLTTGKDVPHQIVNTNGISYLRIVAAEVPSAGYKCYEILSGPDTAPTDAAATIGGTDNNTLENSAVKLVVDPDGAISSLIDKTRGNAELCSTIGGLKINDLSPNDATGRITVENSGPVSVTLRCSSTAGLAHTTWITLYRNSDRVDIRNQITTNFTNVRYWSFGFNLSNPNVHTEEVGAIIQDKLKSQGGDYSDARARYDHVTVNHFADITNGSNDRGVTLSNADLSFAKLGNSTTTLLDTSTPQINMLAGGQVDGPWLGIQKQNGNSNFLQRFALRAHGGYDQTAAMKFALEHQNPLATGSVIGDATGPYAETSYSLLSVSDPNVMLWAVKPAEEGIDKGIVVRLWNQAEKPVGATITVTPTLASANRTTHIETDLEAVSVDGGRSVPTSYTNQQLQTYRLKLAPTSSLAPTP